MVAGIPLEFVVFALTLAGVALFHRHTLAVALLGLAAVVACKIALGGFAHGTGLAGLAAHLGHEWVGLANLFALLVGFALLAAHFHDSRLPDALPLLLPDDWKGGLALLAMVFVLSAFLDNIAAALIGGTIASTVYRGRVHTGFLAAIVAASNAGGSGSVVGDTTTTMMWIAGVHPLTVMDAYIAAVVAFAFVAVAAARQQHRYQPIAADPVPGVRVDWARIGVVGLMLAAAMAVNLVVNLEFPRHAGDFPFLGVAVWIALIACAPLRRPAWGRVPAAARGAAFLLALVFAASLMPIEKLPQPSWQATLGLGYVSAVFDNIPLTALALQQDGYDWGVLAYAVGFGGSMIWFGSSAGVALCGQFPQARSVGAWLRGGWHVAIAYPLGFLALLWVLGWHAEPIGAREGARPAARAGRDGDAPAGRCCPPGRAGDTLRIFAANPPNPESDKA